MRNFKLAKVLIIFVATFIIANLMPTISRADENDLVKMNVSYGIEGSFKGSISIPVNVEVENNGDDIKGEVEVRVPTNIPNTYDAFVEEVNLTSKEKRTVSIPINLPENASKIYVVFKQGENILKENTVILSNGRVNENDMFMGVLTDDFNGLTIRYLDFTDLNNKGKGIINKTASVSLDLESLRRNSKSISALDVIIINNYNMSNLQSKQYDNLSTWIENGGILVIGTGENAPKTMGSVNKEFIDCNYSGTKNINDYTIADLSIKDASNVLQEGENPLIYAINKGKGKIYVSTFDLGNKNIASKENVMKAWKECLGNDFLNKRNFTRHGNYVPFQMEQLINRIPNVQHFKMGTLVIIFLSYALLIGIIIYFVMKKFNKREWLWGVIPVIAISFSILLYVIGGSTRINDIVLNQVNVIISNKNGTGNTLGYLGISSKYKGDLIVEEPKGTNLQNYVNDNYYYDRNQSTNNFTKLSSKTVYRENNSYYEFKELSALDMKKFLILGHKEIIPEIKANLNYNSQKLVGTINNTLGYDIKKILVVSSNNVWDLGEIKSNENLNVDINSNFAFGLSQYGESLEENYYKNYEMSKNKKEIKDKYKDVFRISSLISSLGESNIEKSAYLVAITDMPIDYSFEFGAKSISKYDTTAIVQDININFSDNEGNLNYPLGYFRGDTVQEESSIQVETLRNEIYGSGDLILEYSINKELNILDLKLGYIPSNNNSAKFKGDIYVYNYEKNDYDKTNYVVNGQSLNNPNQYIKDGKIRVKFHGNDEEGIGIPQIAIKGRTK